MVVAQRDSAQQQGRQLSAVAEKEEHEIDHNAQAGHKLDRVLPDAQQLSCNVLAALHGARRELVAQCVEIADPHAREPVIKGGRQ